MVKNAAWHRPALRIDPVIPAIADGIPRNIRGQLGEVLRIDIGRRDIGVYRLLIHALNKRRLDSLMPGKTNTSRPTTEWRGIMESYSNICRVVVQWAIVNLVARETRQDLSFSFPAGKDSHFMAKIRQLLCQTKHRHFR